MRPKVYRIQNIETGMWWHNSDGWIEKKYQATTFSPEERSSLSLPMGGRWVFSA